LDDHDHLHENVLSLDTSFIQTLSETATSKENFDEGLRAAREKADHPERRRNVSE
jgi:hypothetical protein